MITKGKWHGQYRYDRKAIQKRIGFEQTNFEIEIQTIVGNKFNGVVQDDLSTGGTPGIGKISGKVIGEEIEFVKEMPILSLLTKNNGAQNIPKKNHLPVYYHGTFSEDKLSISGHWEIRSKFIWTKIFIGVAPHTKGSWEMKLDV